MAGKVQLKVREAEPEKFKTTLKIGCRKDRVRFEAIMSDFDGEACLVVLPKDSLIRLVTGEDVELDVPSNEGLKMYRGTVAEVGGRFGEICSLKDITFLQYERRRAERLTVHSSAEYCELQHEKTG